LMMTTKSVNVVRLVPLPFNQSHLIVLRIIPKPIKKNELFKFHASKHANVMYAKIANVSNTLPLKILTEDIFLSRGDYL